MIDYIALIVLFGSAIGIGIIIFKKMPALANFSYSELSSSENRGVIVKIKNRIKHNVFLKAISSGEFLLLKILSSLRIIALKSEHKIGYTLSNLRKKSIEKKKSFSDNYWEKIKVKKVGKKLDDQKEK